MVRDRRAFLRVRQAVCTIQAYTRGMYTRRIFHELEQERKRLQSHIDKMEELAKSKELESENKKLKNDLNELRKTVSDRAPNDDDDDGDSAANELQESYKQLLGQLAAANEELDIRKEEVLLLRTQIVSGGPRPEPNGHIESNIKVGVNNKSPPPASLDKEEAVQTYQEVSESNRLSEEWAHLNEDGELVLAYDGLKLSARSRSLSLSLLALSFF
ncbi:hypothetical protein CRUP_006772 [Coryphaenoides rupestris]|nr:hypothetical protein CRUP_006772 [Coryphaenoides rupestris]